MISVNHAIKIQLGFLTSLLQWPHMSVVHEFEANYKLIVIWDIASYFV